MNLELFEKVFIISGSSRGIGKGIAKILLEEGGRVTITGRNKDFLNDTYSELINNFPDSIVAVNGDLNDLGILEMVELKTLNKWKRIDGLVANIGSVRDVPTWKITDEDWSWYYENNFKVAQQFIQRLLPNIIKSEGSIVIIGSIAGLEDIGAPLPYAATKAALIAYMKGLSSLLASHKIRVNLISPGNIRFPGGNWDKKYGTNPDKINKMLNLKVPMNMFGSPEDIGSLSAFLLSKKARFITGGNYVVDGGQTRSFS